MNKPEFIERRNKSLDGIIKTQGEHAEAISNLKNSYFQGKQDFVNHKVEVIGLVEKVERGVEKMIAPLISDVGIIKKILWMGGGSFGTIMFLLELYRTFK